MGDRAVVVFEDGGDFSPGVYLHWDGYRVRELLEDAVPRLRKGDHLYSAARFCGVCHERIEGNLSLGLLPPPEIPAGRDRPDFSMNGYGQGDEGVLLVDARTFMVRRYDWRGAQVGEFELEGGR